MSESSDAHMSVPIITSHPDHPVSRTRRTQIAALLPAMLQSMNPTLTTHEKIRKYLERLHILHLQTIDDTTHQTISDSQHLCNITSGRYVTSVQQLFNDASKFYRITRMTVSEFLLLHSELMPELSASRSSGNVHDHHHPVLTTYEQLLLWFMYGDTGNSVIISLLFGNIHPRSVDNYAQHVTDTIISILCGEIHWPDAQERSCLYGLFSIDDKAIGVLDGTHCEIRVPTNDEEEYYSGYKKMCSQNYLVVVNVLGLVVYFDGPYAGRYNDRGIYNNCDLAINTATYFSSGEKILADGGFIGGLPLIVPATKVDIRSAATEEERKRLRVYNREFGLNRSLVEHTIHFVKDRARLLTMRWPKAAIKQAKYLKAGICIYNYIRFQRIKAAINA
jgi:hypothetical protein